MTETNESLRSEIDALREQIANEKIAVAIAEATATEDWRNARLVAEREALRVELASMGVTSAAAAAPAAPAAAAAPAPPVDVPADDPRADKR